MKVCKLAADQITALEKSLEEFSNPVSFWYAITKHIFLNGFDITTDIFGAMNAYKSQDYEDFGFNIGKAVALAIYGRKGINTITVQDIPDILQGILNGISAETGYNEISGCVNVSEAMANNLTIAAAEITTGQYQEVLHGIIQLAETLQVLPEACQECKAAAGDIQKLWNAISQLKSPKAFIYNVGKNLLINGQSLYDEFSNATNAYENQDWNQFGYFIGEAFATLIWGNPNNGTILRFATVGDVKANVLAFAEGVVDGVLSKENWPAIEACIHDSEDIAAFIDQAYNNFTSQEANKVKEGMKALGEALKIVPDAIQECKVAVKDVKDLIKAVEVFINPSSFFFHALVSLLLNGREVIHDVTSAMDALEVNDFYDCGLYSGKALAVIFLGNKGTMDPRFAQFVDGRVGWSSKFNPKFAGMTYEEIESTFVGAQIIRAADVEDATVYDYTNLVKDIPVQFNASQEWPGCVHPIRNQAQCGSCWAFGATETLSDRFCIASNKSIDVILSPQWLVSCDKFAFGCNGGNLWQSWQFMKTTGVVVDSCLPYTSQNGTVEACPSKCKDGSDIKKYHAKEGTIAFLSNPQSIQVDLMQYGPVDTGMEVYEDFMNYNGGIYKHTSGKLLGGHAIKIIGWGQQNGENYWIVANSWGTDWGLDGFFLIAFGQCGIDSDAVSGQANLKKFDVPENGEDFRIFF